jgi:hypothetical protein
MNSEIQEVRDALTHSQVRELVGDILDAKVVAIIDTEATFEELEEAVAWASGESDVMGEAQRPLAGPAANIYEILTIDSESPEDRRT